jgi:hypothetical protein
MSSPCTIELRSARKALRELSDTVKHFLAALDVEMKKPSSLERGSRIATASNALELRNDIVRRHNLNLPLGR